MKLKSEYTVLSECVERGIELGYARAFKRTNTPTEDVIKAQIYEAVTHEIAEYFSFEENYE